MDLLLNITLPLWHLHELNSIIAGAHQSTDIQSLAFFGHIREIEPYIRASVPQTIIPRLVVTEDFGEMHFKNVAGVNNNVFFVAVGQLDRKAFWNQMNHALSDMQSRVRGVFITTRPSRRGARLDLGQHFVWCWRRGLTNTLILVDRERSTVRQFDIYNYNPFVENSVFNVSHELRVNLYPDKFRNLYQYPIRTSAQFDPPRVFERRDCRARSNQELSGYVANMFRAFVREYNASIHLVYRYPNRSYNILNIIEQLNRGEIELAINPYVPNKRTHLSYPIRMMTRCVVVPSAREVAKYRYFIMPFDSDVWLCFVGAWLLLSLTRLLGWLSTHRHCTCRVLDVGQTLLEVWRLMVFLPIPSNCCSKSVRWYHAVWFVLTVALAFILSNLYLASLTSYFSGLTFQRQISTLAQLVEHRMEIETTDYEVPAILENHGLPRGFPELIKPRDFTELLHDILSLRHGHVYSALDDRILFVLNQEKHLLKPRRHVVEECINTVPFGFVIPVHSYYEHPLNRFILRCASAGLIDKWFTDSLQDAYCSGILTTRISEFQVARPLELGHFQFGWYVLACGYTVSLTIFLVENLRRISRRFRLFVIYY